MRLIGKALLLVKVLLWLGISAGAASAGERYVDNSGSSPCRDSPSAGAKSQPWCRINYAVGHAKPGDVVYVKNGTYRENVYISGINGGPNFITFQNYPGHSPVILGSGVDSGRNKIVNSSFIKFIGFTITSFQQGLFVDTCNNVILQNLKVYNIGQEAVRIRLNSRFITFQDSVVYDSGKWRYNGEGIYIGTSSSQQPISPPYDNTHDILVKNNTIYNTTEECIELKEGTYNITIDE